MIVIHDLAVSVDEPTAAFDPTHVLERELTPTGEIAEARRALVELRYFPSGMYPHALLGGSYVPGGDTLVVRAHVSAYGGSRTCRSQLQRRNLFPGILSGDADFALDGLARSLDVGPGTLTLDRGGWDDVNTSPHIVRMTADLLGRVLSVPPGVDVTEDQVDAWRDEVLALGG